VGCGLSFTGTCRYSKQSRYSKQNLQDFETILGSLRTMSTSFLANPSTPDAKTSRTFALYTFDEVVGVLRGDWLLKLPNYVRTSASPFPTSPLRLEGKFGRY
jgi:hypothetical protein